MTKLSVLLWGFSGLCHHSSPEFSKRVNRSLGQRGTSVSTWFRLSKGLWQLGTIPREIFPAGRELSLKPLLLCRLKSYPSQRIFAIISFRNPFLVPPSSWGPSLFWMPRAFLPVLSCGTVSFSWHLLEHRECMFSPLTRQRVRGRNRILLLVSLQCLLQGCTHNRPVIRNQWTDYVDKCATE